MNQEESAKTILGHILRPRVILYTVILMAITAAAAWSLAHRIPLKVDVIRDRSVMSREVEGGLIENAYTLRIMNTDENPHTYSLAVSGLKGIHVAGASSVAVPGASTQTVLVTVRAEQEEGRRGASPIHFDITATEDANITLHEKASFLFQ